MSGKRVLRKRDIGVVYRFRDADGRLLYIGSSSNLAGRLTLHEYQTPWFHEVASVEVTHFPVYEEAAEAEKRAISDEQPLYNVQHNKVPSLRGDVLQALAEIGEPVTAAEIAFRVRSYPPSSVHAMVSLLHKSGEVVVVGTRKSRYGRTTNVVQLVTGTAA